jgi:glycerol-3-phosphate dehydrogenase
MWLYDLLSLFRGIARHRILRPAGCREIEPGLAKQALRGGALYFDAAVDDVRLTLAAARAAWLAGAAMVPRAEVVRFRSAGRHLEGVAVHDRLRGRDAEVHARLVINATGPWSDTLRRLADPHVRPRLRPTKGVHVMLRRERIGSRGALIFASPLDGRVMFVLPWRDRVYVGTTDTDYEGLFPDARLTPADVVSTWAGVRPLLAAERDPQLAAGATSREHEVWRDRSGLLNIAGGKLTTYRVMAVEAADAAAELLRSDGVVVETAPAPAPLPGCRFAPAAASREPPWWGAGADGRAGLRAAAESRTRGRWR